MLELVIMSYVHLGNILRRRPITDHQSHILQVCIEQHDRDGIGIGSPNYFDSDDHLLY